MEIIKVRIIAFSNAIITFYNKEWLVNSFLGPTLVWLPPIIKGTFMILFYWNLFIQGELDWQTELHKLSDEKSTRIRQETVVVHRERKYETKPFNDEHHGKHAFTFMVR
jgi:hypothetical protein